MSQLHKRILLPGRREFAFSVSFVGRRERERLDAKARRERELVDAACKKLVLQAKAMAARKFEPPIWLMDEWAQSIPVSPRDGGRVEALFDGGFVDRIDAGAFREFLKGEGIPDEGIAEA